MYIGRFALAVLIVVFLAGSSTAAPKKNPNPPAAKRPQAAAVNAGEKKPGVAAVVNGADIGLIAFTAELYKAQYAVLSRGIPLSTPQVSRLRTDVLEGLIRLELLYQESKKTVRVTEAEIAAELAKLKDQMQSGDFTKASPALRVQVERGLSIRKYIDATYASKAQVTDKEIRSYYDQNRHAFRQPEQVRAGYILIKVDAAANQAKRSEARKKIEDIRKKAVAGEDFAALARTHSEDPTAKNGGDMGFVREGQLLKPIEEALFTLKPGEVSDIVETTIGYQLVKLVERRPETTVPFENVKDRLRAVLEQEKKQQEANAYIAKVREKAAVQTFLPEEE